MLLGVQLDSFSLGHQTCASTLACTAKYIDGTWGPSAPGICSLLSCRRTLAGPILLGSPSTVIETESQLLPVFTYHVLSFYPPLRRMGVLSSPRFILTDTQWLEHIKGPAQDPLRQELCLQSPTYDVKLPQKGLLNTYCEQMLFLGTTGDNVLPFGIMMPLVPCGY